MRSPFVPQNPFAPPVFDDLAKTRAARLANTILYLILVLVIVVPVVALLTIPAELGQVMVLAVPMAFIVLGSLRLLRRGQVQLVGVLLVGSFYLIITGSLVTYQGVRDLGNTGYFVVVALAGLLLGARGAIVAGLVCGVTALGIFLAEVNGLIVVTMEPVVPFSQFIGLVAMLGLVTLLLHTAVRQSAQSLDQATRSRAALAEAYGEVAASRDALQEQTQELQRHSAYLEGSAEVGQAASSILDPEFLMERVVELVRQRFGLYYVGLFLLDESQKQAVLRAGTGEAGRAMLARHHSITVGEGMVGWSIAHRRARVALQAAEDAVRLATSELPETRSEAALPMRSRGQIVGALTVQDVREGVFDEDTLTVLQTMADQVGVALDNARLYAESQAALEAERRAYGEISRTAWAELVRGRGELGYVSRPGEPVQPVPGNGRPDRAAVAADASVLVLPICIRDHEIGSVTLRKREGTGGWSAEETDLMRSLTAQVEGALDSARLYQDTQERAFRDRLMGEVVGRIRETLEIEGVLRTAAQEIRQALDLPEVVVRLRGEPDAGAGNVEGV